MSAYDGDGGVVDALGEVYSGVEDALLVLVEGEVLGVAGMPTAMTTEWGRGILSEHA